MQTRVRPLLALVLQVCGAISAISLILWADLSLAEPAALPADPALRGAEIFRRADARDSGYRDLEVGLTMRLISARGRITERDLRIRQLEMPDDGDRVLVVFDSPANIRGTALLSHRHLVNTDDQWLFLPALNRVKKIASRNKSGPFLGSEFSFEDLAPQVVEKFSYAYVKEELLNERPAYVVDRFPVDKYSGYAYQRVWLDVQRLTVEQIEFVNRRDETTKGLQVRGFAQYGDYWKPAFMRMENLRSGKSTELLWRDYEFARGFAADRDFSVNSLRRAR